MNLRKYQRIFELSAVAVMIAGMFMMNNRSDPQHFVIYFGFVLLAVAKMLEALSIPDPNFKIIKMVACATVAILALLNIFYAVHSIIYIMIPLGVYYVLHYRLMFQQRKT